MDLVDEFIDDSQEGPEIITGARRLMGMTYADKGEIDALLTKHARHWGLGRLALVDRNILRLASCELRQGREPYKVVISEALRLAQEFSTAESPRFINGILDAVSRDLGRNDSTPPPAGEDAPGDLD